MDAIVQMKTAAMLRKLAGGDLQHIGGYPFAPQKKGLYYAEQELSPLPRSRNSRERTRAQSAVFFVRLRPITRMARCSCAMAKSLRRDIGRPGKKDIPTWSTP